MHPLAPATTHTDVCILKNHAAAKIQWCLAVLEPIALGTSDESRSLKFLS